jgi:hypothetical protein
MASPKTTPTRKIGIMLMIALGWSTSRRSPSQPHWKTATTAPSAASRKPRAALRGTRTERKTSVSRRKARPTTSPRCQTPRAGRIAASV